MSNGEDLDIMFEVDMENYERNRMYPPGHGKELSMKKPVRKHVSAVRHAKQLLKTAAHRLPTGQNRDDLLEDVKLLTEVATMVHYQIVNPTLPFAIPDESLSHNTLKRGERPMFNKLADTACEIG